MEKAIDVQGEIAADFEKVMHPIQSTSDARTANNTMRHAYRVLTDAEKSAMEKIKDVGEDLHTLILALGNSRETALAKTKLEEAVMWAVKHITK